MAPSRLPDLLVPPRSRQALPGSFTWPQAPRLAAYREADLASLEDLGDDLRARRLKPVRQVGSGAATLTIRPDASLGGDEAYVLTISRTGIEIRARGAAGAFYGVQTLRELASLHGPAPLPCQRIEDAPDFARRGVYYDCSRGKVPQVATVCELIAFLARYKINELQLYVENVFTFASHPGIGAGYDPFTPADILEIQACARRHHLRLVPSLASFGHLERVLALPAYRKLGELPGHLGYPGGTTLNPCHPGSIRLLEDLFADYLPLHDATDFNACGDEPWELGQGRSRKTAPDTPKARLYGDFIQRINRASAAHGKRLNLWADIVLEHPEHLPEMPRDVTYLNWEYGPDPTTPHNRMPRSRAFAELGLDWIACPGSNNWTRYTPAIAQGFANIRHFSATAREFKASGFLNTDWGDAGHRNLLGLSLPAMAYGGAHAWNGAAVRDADFFERFCQQELGDTDGGIARAIHAWDRIPWGQHSNLYHALLEPLPRRDGYFAAIDPASPVRNSWWDKANRFDEFPLGQDREFLELIEAHPLPTAPQAKGALMAQARDEIACGRELLRCALARVAVGRAVRAGTPGAARLRQAHGAEIRALKAEFKRLWLRTNRPSRLADNLAMLG